MRTINKSEIAIIKSRLCRETKSSVRVYALGMVMFSNNARVLMVTKIN